MIIETVLKTWLKTKQKPTELFLMSTSACFLPFESGNKVVYNYI